MEQKKKDDDAQYWVYVIPDANSACVDVNHLSAKFEDNEMMTRSTLHVGRGGKIYITFMTVEPKNYQDVITLIGPVPGKLYPVKCGFDRSMDLKIFEMYLKNFEDYAASVAKKHVPKVVSTKRQRDEQTNE